MIYANKERAVEVAKSLREDPMLGRPHMFAALTVHGWTVRHDHGYSNGDVLEWAR
jgi:hypothetical protein